MTQITTPNYLIFKLKGDSLAISLFHIEITNNDSNKLHSTKIDNPCRRDMMLIRDAVKILSGFGTGDKFTISLDLERLNSLYLVKDQDGVINAEFLVDEEEDELIDDGLTHYYYISDILEYSVCKDYDALIDLLDYIINM